MPAHTVEGDVFPAEALERLRRRIEACPYFTVNTLNRDFVGTRGFSVVFVRDALPRVRAEFPYFVPYLDRALLPGCNAFYLNPLLLVGGSRVDPHVDRSLRSYCPDVTTPHRVSVLYVAVPPGLRGGALVLHRGKRFLARVVPAAGSLVTFDGDLTHGVDRVESDGARMSLVCEQYCLRPEELERIPAYAIETRAAAYGTRPGRGAAGRPGAVGRPAPADDPVRDRARFRPGTP